MKRLIGHIIQNITFNEEDDTIVIVTDKSKFYLTPEGDCCAHAYIYDFDQNAARAICGQMIHEAHTYGFDSEDHYYGSMDTEFYSIQTHGGDLDIELRTEHNGYYGGRLNISEIPLNS